jgi:cellulose synthase/poly-beta-1,6-N-acetylglucosamine synthase-like glycosyltransferase
VLGGNLLCYPSKMSLLLHEENFKRIIGNGARIKNWLQQHAEQVLQESGGLQDPDISIVIRTRNDGTHIKRLFEDIHAQTFTGAVEIIVVDTESRDDTVEYAKSQGAKIINVTQKDFSYPRALNRGFEAATYPWVLTLVGHSCFSSSLFLKSLTYWINQEKELKGIYGLPLANWNASVWERLENIIGPSVWKESRKMRELSIGIMGANCSIVNRAAWRELGGYDERYGAGGEDRIFAQTMLDHNMTIIREPLCSVFHSHGLGLKDDIKQWLHWSAAAKQPAPFDTHRVHARRPDLH